MKVKKLLMFFAFIVMGQVHAQTAITITAIGSSGSYATGSVNSAGTKNDDLMTNITSSTNRGWAVFDLSAIPTGSTINTVTLKFTTTSNTVLSTATNYIGGYAWSLASDPATVAGATLYTSLNATSGTNFNASSWTANALQTKALNAAGVALISGNLGGKVVISFVRGSTNNYEIDGYGSSAPPTLEIDYLSSVPCSGTPAAGVASGPASGAVCPGAAFSLSSNAVNGVGGITYDWQSNDGSGWISSGGTSINYTVASGITVPTDYRLIATCTNTNDQDTSNVVSLTVNPFYNCYCTPVSTCVNEGIDSVSFDVLSNSSAFCVGSGYSDYASLGALATVSQAQAAVITVRAHINSNPASVGLWIDYDHSGTFDAGEYTSLGSTTGISPLPSEQIFSGNVIVPITAQTGITRMRIRSANQGGITATSACNTGTVYGEYEDYLITINPGISCTGTPVGGTVYGADSVCPNIAFTLVDTGMTSAVGITYQWETSPTGAGVWTPITGATNLSYTQVAGITAATDYHLMVTCTNGGGTDVSNTYTVNMKSFVACYCTPGTTNNNSSDNILNVTFAGINNTTTAGGVNGYVDYTNTVSPAQVLAGLSYPYSMTINNGGTEYGGVWFDWDHSGTFDTSEFTYVGTGTLTPLNTTINVPATALSGTTRMRVRSKYNTLIVNTDPCTGYSYGETEDYLVYVTVPTPCSGTPVAGTAFGPDSVCANTSFNLTDTAFTAATGITYQWEESPAGAGVWTPITGATNPYFTVSAGITSATDYQMVITCTNGGGMDVSNTFTVNLNPFYKCYCSPLTGTVLNSYYFDNYITNVSIPSTTLNSTTTVAGPGGYMMLDPTIAGNTATLIPSLTYTINTSTLYGGDPVGGWIDYDQSGTFDSAEYISFTGTTASFTVPVTATGGNTGMRIRNNDWIMSYDAFGACADNYYGETEDYIINIATLTTCNGTPSAGTAFGPDSMCASVPFTLNDTAMTIGSGVTYQWEESPYGAGVWTAISGATTPSYLISAGITTPTDYRLVVTCSNGGGQDISGTISVAGIYPASQCYCTPTGTSTNYGVSSFTTTGGVTNINNTNSGLSPNSYGNFTNMVLNAIPGTTINFSASYLTTASYGFALWIDWDQDGSFAQPGDLIYNSTSYGYSSTGSFTIPLTAPTGSTRIRIIANELNSNPSTQYCDDPNYYGAYAEWEDYTLTIAPPPTCMPVTGLTTGATLFNSADVSWNQSSSNPAGGYYWIVVPQGAGTSATPISSGLEVAGDTMATATGLSASTAYTMYVRSVCSSVDSSFWANIDFTTPCSTFVAPYVESFNASTTPNCWTSTGTGDNWLYSQGSGPNYGVQGSTEHTGNGGYFAWVDGSTPNGSNITLLSPVIDISTLTTPRVRYYVKSYNIDDAQNNRLVVSALNGGTWVTIDSIQFNFPTSGWYERNLPLSAVTSTTTQLRFVVDELNNVGSSFYNDILIDDINVENTPTCVAPTGLAATNVTTTSADLAWTENGTATQWSIEYGPTGFTPGAGTFVSVTTNPYTLTGLSAGTAYDIYVKSICSATDSSIGNGPVTINTDQIPVTGYPYAINWDNGGGGWTYANGNQTNKWFVGAPGNNPATTLGATPGGLYISSDGGVTNGYNNGTSSTVHAYRDLDLSSFSSAVPLTFNSYIVGEASLPYIYDYLSVWMVPISYEPVPGTDLSTVSGAVPIDTIVLETGWTQHLLTIPASVTGSTSRLVLQWRNDASSGSAPVKVDNLTIGGFPLVIKLKDISATNLGAKNRVDWSTESELKSDKFELERSADGRNFTYLATIKAKGEASNYSYVDLSPVTGVNYYRLKMIDAAGAVATSKVVTATVKQGAFTVEAYPNPVSEQLTVKVYGGSDQNATVAITDITGKVMKVVTVVNGKAEVNMNGLAQGVYLVKYTDNNHSQTIKVNKQ